MTTKNIGMILLLVGITSFLLHFGWEALHVPLYSGYEGLNTLLPLPVFAALGDVLYTLLAVGIVSLFKKSGLGWMAQVGARDFVGLAVLGFFLAVGVEYKALALGRWEYAASMPLVPFFYVGLSPVAQMTILLPFSVYIGYLLLRATRASRPRRS